jgi:hypothetical protein
VYHRAPEDMAGPGSRRSACGRGGRGP